MKKMIAFGLVLICILGLSGCKTDDIIETFPDLNMGTLKSLVDIYNEKDKEMSWETFAPYYYKEEVDGDTYIRRYSVDKDFFLIIEGNNAEETPMHMKLVLRNDPNKYIDIRYESIDDFLNAI